MIEYIGCAKVILFPGSQGQSRPAGKQDTASASARESLPSTGLPLKAGFSWNAANDSDDEDVDMDDDSGSTSESETSEDNTDGDRVKKKTNGGHHVVADKTGDVRTKQPESTAEFERALVSSPNSSYLWIQFMSFQLALSEIDKARKIGRRALDTIAFREEEEKLNIWLALLNLENAHGSPESFDKLFKEAAQYNDAKTVYLRAATILAQSNKAEAAAELYQRACKKFGQSPDVWASYAEFEITTREDAEAARALLPRSLKSLPASARKSAHQSWHRKSANTDCNTADVVVIEKFAILEFRHGDAERGKTIFEGLVDRHPKRLDIWNAYVDQMVKLGDVQPVRYVRRSIILPSLR